MKEVKEAMMLIDGLYEFEAELMKSAEQTRSVSKLETAEALVTALKEAFVKNNSREFLKRWGLLLVVKEDRVQTESGQEE